MYKVIILASFFLFISCHNSNDEYNLLYKNLDVFNEDLKSTIKGQQVYLYRISLKNSNNSYQKRRYDSLSKIDLKLENYINEVTWKERQEVLLQRDLFKKKYNLYLNLIPETNYKNINDSVFGKLIKNEFLRLRREFQMRYMFSHGDPL